MINVLIADDNVHFATYLMNYIADKNSNIRVCNIAKNGEETIFFLNNKKNIDIVLLDLKMPIYTGNQVLSKITDKCKYEKSIIVISEDYNMIRELNKNDMVYMVLNKTLKMDKIDFYINELVGYKENKKEKEKIKDKIIKELLFLGYDISHKGTEYLIRVIEILYINFSYRVFNLNRDIYPIIAVEYKTSVNNIKCNINRATRNMYYQCEITKLCNYFMITNDEKPKIKTIINIILNKL